MARYQAILFDFDGVLMDTEPLHYACWQDVLNPFGIKLGWDYYSQNCIGVSDRAMIQTLLDLSGNAASFDELWAQYPRKKELFRERVRENAPMPLATRDLLHALDGYKLAVVSSSGRAEVEPPLVAMGVRDRFETLVCGGDVKNLKPSPEPYQLAAERLGIERALVVEDSAAGVASGRAAGFDVLMVTGAQDMALALREYLGCLDRA